MHKILSLTQKTKFVFHAIMVEVFENFVAQISPADHSLGSTFWRVRNISILSLSMRFKFVIDKNIISHVMLNSVTDTIT